MFRNLHLGLAQDFLKVTDAERRAGQEMENPQARSIAETLVNLDEVDFTFHARRLAVG
jgi:hypothetical protein